jgi:hypothetical protein
MKRVLAGMACLVALSGCAEIEKRWEALEEIPYDPRIRQFPTEGVFLAQPRYRTFLDEQDPVFATNPYKVQHPRPDEERSPLMRLSGVYRAGAALPRFVDCNNDRSYRVAGGEEAALLEQAVAQAQAAGPVMVVFDGRIVLVPRPSGSGVEQVVEVEKFDQVLGGPACAPRSVAVSR